MAHIDSDGLSLEEFYNLEFRDDEEPKKKKKKHKNKKKDKKYKSYKKSKKNKKSYKKKHSVVDRILDAVDVNLDSEIKISITDETINNAINKGIDLVRFLRDRKKSNNNLEQPKEVPMIPQSSNDDNND